MFRRVRYLIFLRVCVQFCDINKWNTGILLLRLTTRKAHAFEIQKGLRNGQVRLLICRLKCHVAWIKPSYQLRMLITNDNRHRCQTTSKISKMSNY